MNGADEEPTWDDDKEQDEWIDEPDADDPEGDTLPCPSCGEPVYDDSDRCPHCGDWIMPLSSAAQARSRVWIIAAVLVILAIILWTVT